MPVTSDSSRGAGLLKLDLLLRTIIENPYIPHDQEPHPKQADFLTTPEREVLYGGAGGGGKSSALLMAALQYVMFPGYAAILFRRTHADLTKSGALIERAAEWLHGTDAKWNEKKHSWSFPSGARLDFGYLDAEKDKDNYRSAEYQFVGFDELTTFPEGGPRFLFSRLRRLKDSVVPIRMRAASNPGGVGHDWVKKRFIDTEKPGRRFIPAYLADNPSLDAEEYKRSLAELDPITRAQILAGDWDAYQGGRYQADWLKKRFARQGDYYVVEGNLIGSKAVSVFQTVDHAATVKRSGKDDPDYSVISTWGVTPQRWLLWLGCERFRAEVPEVLQRLKESAKAWKPEYTVIEGGGTQKALLQFARQSGLIVREYLPGGRDKLQKAARSLVLAEQGRIYLPQMGSWVEDALGELLRFTGDERRDSHDDIVDTLAMAAEQLSHFELKAQGFAPHVIGGG